MGYSDDDKFARLLNFQQTMYAAIGFNLSQREDLILDKGYEIESKRWRTKGHWPYKQKGRYPNMGHCYHNQKLKINSFRKVRLAFM